MGQIDMFAENKLTPKNVKTDLIKLGYDNSFDVKFTNQKLKNVLGFYRFSEKCIYIHPELFKNNNDLMMTALHEYAHHLDYINNGRRKKPHTGSFKLILKKVEAKAIQTGIISDYDFKELDEIYSKAVSLGKSIVDFAIKPECADPTDAMSKKLYGISATALRHIAKIYNTDRKYNKC